jgi:hypothetical protein
LRVPVISLDLVSSVVVEYASRQEARAGIPRLSILTPHIKEQTKEVDRKVWKSIESLEEMRRNCHHPEDTNGKEVDANMKPVHEGARRRHSP